MYSAPHVTGAHVWSANINTTFNALLRTKVVDDFDSGGNRTGFTLVLKDGSSEHYSMTGQLQSISNPAGLVHHYNYDSRSRLLSITDDFGHHLDFSYIANDGQTTYAVSWLGNTSDGTGAGSSSLSLTAGGIPGYFDAQYSLRSVTDGVRTVNYNYSFLTGSDGISTPFAYKLTSVQHADGTTVQYVYGEKLSLANTPASYLTGIIDESGVRTSNFSYISSSYAMVEKQWRGTSTPGSQSEQFEFTGGGIKDPWVT
jgi:YD repeat-containing protein